MQGTVRAAWDKPENNAMAEEEGLSPAQRPPAQQMVSIATRQQVASLAQIKPYAQAVPPWRVPPPNLAHICERPDLARIGEPAALATHFPPKFTDELKCQTDNFGEQG